MNIFTQAFWKDIAEQIKLFFDSPKVWWFTLRYTKNPNIRSICDENDEFERTFNDYYDSVQSFSALPGFSNPLILSQSQLEGEPELCFAKPPKPPKPTSAPLRRDAEEIEMATLLRRRQL